MDAEFEKKRLRELALRARHGGRPCFTRFLEPPMERDARAAASAAEVSVDFFGGFEGAERRIAAFYADEAPEAADYPLACLELRWNPKYASPGHRDLLGAAMGLGLERDSTGDIAMGAEDGAAYLFAHRDVAEYLRANFEQAGRAKLNLREIDAQDAKLRPPEGEYLRVTLASFRLDALLAAALKLSRGEAQRLIEGGQVKRNHLEILRGDASVAEGDLLSVRGHDRLRVESFEGITRKGRQAVRLFRYTG